MTDNIDILRKFADAFRSGAQGSTKPGPDAKLAPGAEREPYETRRKQ